MSSTSGVWGGSPAANDFGAFKRINMEEYGEIEFFGI